MDIFDDDMVMIRRFGFLNMHAREINMALFGTSGIRMECPSPLTPELALKVGQAAAQEGKPFVVGFDGRPTGHMVKAAVSAGAAAAGAHVVDIGLCATPTLALHTQNLGGRGAMITASHNPPQYNGIKLFEMGSEAPKEVEARVEQAVDGKMRGAAVEWKRAGGISYEAQKAADAHMALVLGNLDIDAVSRAAPTVALDCGNAAASALMPSLLQDAGCSVIAINSDSPGSFTRNLEPAKENLSQLSDEIVSTGADFGIAHDGDADRAIILDEGGRMLGLDAQLAIAVGEMMEINSAAKNKTIVSTVESSLSLREIVEGAGWKLEITPVGSLFVAQKMRQCGASFGGEPCGEYIFPKGVKMPDGILAGAFFAEIFAKKGKLSSLARKIKTYPILREKLPCKNERKEKAMAAIAKAWPFSKPNTGDGLRSDEAWGWALVRPSGTEPIIRITLEAKTEKEAKKRMQEARAVVEKALA